MVIEKRLIDVNKVIDAMQKCLDESPDQKDTVAYVAFELLITALKQEPTVDAVEVVHGRWITEWDREHLLKICYCSACNRGANKDVHDEFILSEYCPNCGAKMDGDCADGSV